MLVTNASCLTSWGYIYFGNRENGKIIKVKVPWKLVFYIFLMTTYQISELKVKINGTLNSLI